MVIASFAGIYHSAFLLIFLIICGQFVSQLMQFNIPPASAILLMFTATIFLSNISFALFTAVSSCASEKTGRKIFYITVN